MLLSSILGEVACASAAIREILGFVPGVPLAGADGADSDIAMIAASFDGNSVSRNWQYRRDWHDSSIGNVACDRGSEIWYMKR